MLSSGCQHVLTGPAAVPAAARLHAGESCAHERSPWCLCKRRPHVWPQPAPTLIAVTVTPNWM